MRRAGPLIVVAWVAVMGCSRHTETETQVQAPPPEAFQTSPVDRKAAEEPRMFDWSRDLGVAGWDERGVLTLAVDNDSLPEAIPVTLVWLTDPQSVSQAFTGPRRPKPWSHAGTTLEGAAYAITPPAPAHERGAFAIAIVGLAAEPRVQGGHAEVDLDGDGTPETFRQCASGEALHLTVWSGPPLEGPQGWHRYVFLGTDLEADCTEKDTGS